MANDAAALLRGEWIDHDGAYPSLLQAVFGIGRKIEIIITTGDKGLTPKHFGPDFEVTTSYEGFFWRWHVKRKGIFGRKKVAICDNEAFAPIMRYRIVFLTSEAKQEAQTEIEKLRGLARDPQGPITGPEVEPKPKKAKSPWPKIKNP